MLNTQKIADLQNQINELEAADAAFKAMGEIPQLAVALHDTQCRWNHTDGCGWYYEMHTNKLGVKVHHWDGQTHDRYLKRAHKLADCCKGLDISLESAITVISIAKE